ncbi:MAG: hypothetical protein MZV63_47895 [Marinilabiliales bacterium]|nr:hypothetical protein [Marinilabiliales bacterium]
MASDYETAEIKEFVADRINMIPDFRLEYFEIVEDETLVPRAGHAIEMSPDKNILRLYCSLCRRCQAD